MRKLIRSGGPGARGGGGARRAATAAMLLLLGACGRPDVGFGESGWGPLGGGSAWVPFSAGPNRVTLESVTAQRVRGAEAPFQPLLPEAGDVWPAQEAPRPTLLGSPEEAFRNVPEYRPQLIEGAPPARSPVPSPAMPRGSAGLQEALPPPQQLQRIPAQPAFTPPAPPAPRTEGTVLTDPAGRPATVTGQAGRIQGVTQPGVGGGAVIRDGNTETWIGPDGQARTRVVPPR